ncbi:MAG: RsmD family RNA methyltransferase [Holosporaceae bacterium]
MRIIAGRFRGLTLASLPKGSQDWLRPTRDRVKETLFQLLSHGAKVADHLPPLADCWVADMACGSGNLGFEALSRGAAHVVLMDKRPEAFHLAASKAARLNLACPGSSLTIMRGDLRRLPPAPQPCHLILLDPPYGQGLVDAALMQMVDRGWLQPGALVVAETGRRDPVTPPTGWQLLDQRLIGESRLSFLLAPLHPPLKEQVNHGGDVQG